MSFRPIFLAYVICNCLSLVAQEDTSEYIFDTTGVNNSSYYYEYPDSVFIDYGMELIIAADEGDAEKVFELLDKGVDVNSKTYEGVTPLMYAAQNGYLDIVKILVLNGASINMKPYNGITALISATQANRDTIIEYLLKKGAKIDLPDDDSVTALMYAVSGNNLLITDMLLFYGANPEKGDRFGTNSLMAASYRGYTDIAQLLIAKGVNLDARDKLGYTPLMYAAESGDTNMIKLLVWKGASIDAKTNNGMTAVAVAAKNNHTKALELLHKAGAELKMSVSGSMHVTPFTYASANRNKAMKKYLLTHGASRDILPYFNKLSVGLGTDWNFTDFMYDINIGKFDIKYNLGIYLGYSFRLARKRVLYKYNEDIYFQYQEWRSNLYLGIEKQFAVLKIKQAKLGLLLASKGIFSFGDLKATQQKAKHIINLTPQCGIYYGGNYSIVKLAYEYCNYRLYKVSPHRIYLGVIFYIYDEAYSAEHRKEKWVIY
ncbi:MAG: ankyrin repeat domain-containing protein [Bacteroidia bacterium]|nr:ankyrin repeat domain-containing protein [Bacteroidia bacterium]